MVALPRSGTFGDRSTVQSPAVPLNRTKRENECQLSALLHGLMLAIHFEGEKSARGLKD